MDNTKKEILSYLDTVSLILLSALFLVFPLLFTALTTDFFVLPKQILLAVAVSLVLLLYGIRNLVLKKVIFRSTPFDLPIFLFGIVVLISAILSGNRIDALTNYVPLLFSVLLFYTAVNTVRRPNALLLLLSSLVIGGCIVSILTVLSYFKIYVLPFNDTHIQTFSTLGSLLDQSLYLALVLPVAGYIAWPLIASFLMIDENQTQSRTTTSGTHIAFAIAFVVMLVGLGMSVYMFVTMQKPLILPFETGFQTALAAISQDTGRVFKSFLFGTGYGTYLTVFTRFKLASYNLNPDLWSFSFFRSSSLVLELLATTGILGISAFFFLMYRFVRERSFFIPVILVLVASFFLPFSSVLLALFFFIFAVFAIAQALEHPRRYPDLEFSFVASKRGFRPTAEPGQELHAGHDRILPFIILVLLLGVIGFVGYFTARYALSDILLQRSVVATRESKGLETYNNQRDAIAMFPYRDTNYRFFSQTNLALANSLAISQPKDKQPNQEVQQNILTLIQQSINAGRSAVTVSPQTALNWNNLSSVYRALIGFGQNADQFAILTNQQAIRLDPTNPQQLINLGGIYYQLTQWDNAQNQFQIAIQLKQDYANAYYNLGHALEEKGDLQNALRAYQTVKTLVANDPENLKKITAEIGALEKKIGEQAKAKEQGDNLKPSENQPPLGINEPERQLPERKPPVEIPGPTVTVTPKASPTPKVSPAGGPSPTKTSEPTPQF
ncbi:MAG: tetratricopeptide repeat protein [Candidatus Levybacteria bacterium]|nr:tetratricopeptide repeat protein [Candidatus Levybacteria bacterium]